MLSKVPGLAEPIANKARHLGLHKQMGVRISNAIIFNKLKCFELGRHNDLREIDQTI